MGTPSATGGKANGATRPGGLSLPGLGCGGTQVGLEAPRSGKFHK